jgi:hypothetical protein
VTRHSFGRALGFAALAAALSFPVLILGGMGWGYEASFAMYLLALAPLSTFSAAPGLGSGLRAGVVTAVLSLTLVAIVDSVQAALLATLVNLAIGRALLHGPRALGRVLFVELALSALSFGVFAAFRDQHLIGDAIAVWGVWLVQSVFALVTQAAQPRGEEPVDRFVAARAAAERLLQP